MRRTVRHRRPVSPLWPFFIQACFISWFGWLPGLVLGPQRGYALYAGVDFRNIFTGGFQDATHAVVVILFWIAVYGPLLSALGIRQRMGGPLAVRDLLSRMVRWQVPGRWYLAALALPVVTLVPALAVALGTGVAPSQPGLPLAPGWIPLFFLYTLLTSGLAEVGWRGFLLPFLQQRYTAEQASYMVGILWTLWYLPYVVALNQGPGLPFALLWSLVTLIPSAVIYTWLYNNTGSLLVTMLYHALANVAVALAAGWLGTHPGPQLVLGVTLWVIAWALLRRYGPQRLSHSRAAERLP